MLEAGLGPVRETMLSERVLSFAVRMMNGHYLNIRPYLEERLPEPEAGKKYMLYAHVPFCESLCPYCSFNRYPFEEGKARAYFASLRKEMGMLSELGYDFESLYIGGGTPTILPDELEATIRYAKDNFGIKEVSTETNPNHLDPLHLDRLKGLVDRMSVGVQSFDDPLLKAMKRYDKYGSADSIFERISFCADSGYFQTLNVDMIFNFPSQTEEMLIKDIDMIKRCGCNQTTFYPLMASPSVETDIKKSVGRVNYKNEKKFFDIICRGLESREGTAFEPASAWTFSKVTDPDGKGQMTDEYVVSYEEYAAAGSGGMSFINRGYYINTFALSGYEERIARGCTSVSGFVRFNKRDHMRYRFMMQLFGLRLDKKRWERDFGCTVGRGLPAEYLFLKNAGAFDTDDDNEITLTPKGRYFMLVMMRQFFIGVNSVRDEARRQAGITLQHS